jgi:peptide subunit release factor 1 (eRF1)
MTGLRYRFFRGFVPSFQPETPKKVQLTTLAGGGISAKWASDQRRTAQRTVKTTAKRIAMSKQEMREETERLIREAMEKKALSVKQGQTRIETKCGKCGAPNRVSAAPGQTRVEFHCKECGQKQKTL